MLKSEYRKNTSIGTIEGQVTFDEKGYAHASEGMEKTLSQIEGIEFILEAKEEPAKEEKKEVKKSRAKKATKTAEK